MNLNFSERMNNAMQNTETRSCDIWVDIFDNEKDARQFCNDYKKA